MKKTITALVVLLGTSLALASDQVSVVVAVDKETFTIKPEVGERWTFACDPDMGKKGRKGFFRPGEPLGATPEQLKVGMIVNVSHTYEKGVSVCLRAMIIEEHLGTREIDFSPMLAKGEDTLPKFALHIQLQSRPNLGNRRSFTTVIDFKEGASIKEVRDCASQILSGRFGWNERLVARILTHEPRKWKVEEAGKAKLLIESYHCDEKDEPVRSVEIEAKDFPKDRQPRVRLVKPGDPT